MHHPSLTVLALLAALANGPAHGLDSAAERPPVEHAQVEPGGAAGPCPVRGAQLLQRSELYFGLSRPGGTVSEAQFQQFVDTEVTPRFPDGLTLLAGNGQFRGADGNIVQEGTRLLILFFSPNSGSQRAVEEIRSAYRAAFQQESVLRVDRRDCVSF